MTTQLGDYVKRLREAKGYSVRELGSLVGRTHGLITGVETGRRLPSLLRLWDIIRVLDGDFKQALYYLCVDTGIPAEAVEELIQRGE